MQNGFVPEERHQDGATHAPTASASWRTPASDAPLHRAAGAIDRAVDAAQNVVVDQINLARLELERTITSVVGRAAMGGLGLVAFASAWALFMVAAHRLLTLTLQLSPVASLSILGLLSAVLGAVAFAAATGRFSRARDATRAAA